MPDENSEKPSISSEQITEEMYRAFVEQASDGIFVCDANMVLLEVNEMGCRMTGYQREELVGQEVVLLLDPAEAAARPPQIQDLDVGDTSTKFRRILRKDGANFESETNIRRLTSDLFVGIMRDISATKRKEELLRQTNEELEQRVVERTAELADAYRELEDFSYSVAHDLRSPLRAMDGYASILLLEHSYELSEDARSHLERISANARRMGLLIDTLLGYARMGRSPIKLAKLDVASLAHEEWANLNPLHSGRKVQFTVGKIPVMKGDPTLVKLVLTNLLSNAAKFTKKVENPAIEVGYEPETRSVYVRDNGVGFDPRYADKLFRVFERLHTDDFEGTGMGLATVKRIVDKHGGSVWAEGAVNDGATFRFTLG